MTDHDDCDPETGKVREGKMFIIFLIPGLAFFKELITFSTSIVNSNMNDSRGLLSQYLLLLIL